MAMVKYPPRPLAVLAIGCALGGLPILAGCAGGQGGVPTRIVGGVYIEGGPMAQYATAVPKHPTSGTVTATAKNDDGAPSYRAGTASDGTFTLDVAPGSYEVAATTSSGGHVQSVDVTVAQGETVTVELDAYVP